MYQFVVLRKELYDILQNSSKKLNPHSKTEFRIFIPNFRKGMAKLKIKNIGPVKDTSNLENGYIECN